MPDHLKGQDLREPITRLQFAALTVRLYETASGQSIAAPRENPFTDTSDPEALKAYSMGFTAGTSASTFGPGELLTREQAAVMLAAVYRALGGSVPDGTPSFSDGGEISSWAQSSVAFMAQSGIRGRLRRRAASAPRTPPSGRPASSWPCASSRTRLRPHNRAGLSPPVPPRHRRPSPAFFRSALPSGLSSRPGFFISWRPYRPRRTRPAG